MEKKKILAIADSIEHWLDNCTAESIDDFDASPDACALCRLYFPDDIYEDECRGCPIYAYTGRVRCGNSPYIAVSEIQKEIILQVTPNSSIQDLKTASFNETYFLVDVLKNTIHRTKGLPYDKFMAIADSIKHWVEIMDNSRTEDYRLINIGPKDCALCQLYHKNQCEPCPIFEYIGERGCCGTPFSEASHILAAWIHAELQIGVPEKHFIKEFQKQAKKETLFLLTIMREEIKKYISLQEKKKEVPRIKVGDFVRLKKEVDPPDEVVFGFPDEEPVDSIFKVLEVEPEFGHERIKVEANTVNSLGYVPQWRFKQDQFEIVDPTIRGGDYVRIKTEYRDKTPFIYPFELRRVRMVVDDRLWIKDICFSKEYLQKVREGE